VFGLENIGGAAGLLVEEDELMGAGGKYNEVEAGVYFETGVL
jgi:hypothetical protein